MFDPKVTKSQLLAHIDSMSELGMARFLYCQHMAGTYMGVGLFEAMLIYAMGMCDRVRLGKALGPDLDRWQQALKKQALLEGSTLGSLITILERHGVAPSDIAYLRWVKEKRDYFVHRLFHDGAWPGDLDLAGCHKMTRRLVAIQHWLSRAERSLWLIFERAGFVELTRLDDGGLLAVNRGVYDLLEADDDRAARLWRSKQSDPCAPSYRLLGMTQDPTTRPVLRPKRRADHGNDGIEFLGRAVTLTACRR